MSRGMFSTCFEVSFFVLSSNGSRQQQSSVILSESEVNGNNKEHMPFGLAAADQQVGVVRLDCCRSLQETEVNPVRLRTLSGSWFSEERSKRHRSAKPGADLVHSSIRRRKSKGRG